MLHSTAHSEQPSVAWTNLISDDILLSCPMINLIFCIISHRLKIDVHPIRAILNSCVNHLSALMSVFIRVFSFRNVC